MHKVRTRPRRRQRAALEVSGVVSRGFLHVSCPLCGRTHLYDPGTFAPRRVVAHCSRRSLRPIEYVVRPRDPSDVR